MMEGRKKGLLQPYAMLCSASRKYLIDAVQYCTSVKCKDKDSEAKD